MSSKTIASNNTSIDDGDCIFFRELGQNDVLLGRGTGPNENIGNVRFRSLVRDSMQTHRFSTPDEKSELAKKIVNTVKARNGRFMKQVNTRKNCGNIFVEIPDKVSLDKTKQSFRHQLRADAKGDKEIEKYRAKFPRSLIERKSKARAVNKPCAPNANAAAIEEHPPRSSVFNRKLNGPTLSGIMDPGGLLFVDKLIRGGAGASRTASIMVSSPRLFSILASQNAAQQMLSSTTRRELISNRILLLSELMGDYQSRLPATITQQLQRPAMPSTLTAFPLPDSAILDFILQGRRLY
jgi:hypothetical protein